MEPVPSLLKSMFGMKCPKCRKGDMFINKSVWPFKHMLDMPKKCSECGQMMEIEVGFYYGTGYVSYAVALALTIFNLIWYWIIFGLSFRDDSFFWFIGVDVAILAVIQPWLMRYSRVLYLYMFVRYKKGATVETEQR